MQLPVTLLLRSEERQRALHAAAAAANPARGREVFLQTLAITAFQQFWSWLELGPNCPALEGLPGEVGRVGLPQGGSIALLPLVQEVPDAQSTSQADQQTHCHIDWPIDWPDDVVAFVPVGVNRSLDRAWLWGWVSVGDLSLPPAPTNQLLAEVLQDWDSLEPYLWRMKAALAWIAEAIDPIAQQVRQVIAPDERMALVASLDRQYRESSIFHDFSSLKSLNLDDIETLDDASEPQAAQDGAEDAALLNSDLMSDVPFALHSPNFLDDIVDLDDFGDLYDVPNTQDTEDRPDRPNLPGDELLADLALPDTPLSDTSRNEALRDNLPLTYHPPVDRPAAQVRDVANSYRTNPSDANPSDANVLDPNASIPAARDWQPLADLLLERLLPIWDDQSDRLEIDPDAQFNDDLPSDEGQEDKDR